MNQAEKEAYLREYSILKNSGKPFFPYIVAKDSAMAVIVMLVIIFLSLMFGAVLATATTHPTPASAATAERTSSTMACSHWATSASEIGSAEKSPAPLASATCSSAVVKFSPASNVLKTANPMPLSTSEASAPPCTTLFGL